MLIVECERVFNVKGEGEGMNTEGNERFCLANSCHVIHCRHSVSGESPLRLCTGLSVDVCYLHGVRTSLSRTVPLLHCSKTNSLYSTT